MRKKAIINYPHLNNGGGDLTKQWFVEYSHQVPGEIHKCRERVYNGLNIGTTEERLVAAYRIMEEKTEWLKSGEYLTAHNLNCVYEDELTYRSEAKLYGSIKVGLPLMRRNINDYLTHIKPLSSPTSYKNKTSKLRTFSAWLEKGVIFLDIFCTFVILFEIVNHFVMI